MPPTTTVCTWDGAGTAGVFGHGTVLVAPLAGPAPSPGGGTRMASAAGDAAVNVSSAPVSVDIYSRLQVSSRTAAVTRAFPDRAAR